MEPPSAEFLASLVGRRDDDAREKVEKAGLRYRVTRRDGKNMIVTRDFSVRRVSVWLTDGRVEQAVIG